MTFSYGIVKIRASTFRNSRVGGGIVVESMIKLETIRRMVRRKALPVVGSNDCLIVGGILALIGAGGLTTLTGGFASPVALPAGLTEVFAAVIVAIFAAFTIILLPLAPFIL
jgi:hypothetical protein